MRICFFTKSSRSFSIVLNSSKNFFKNYNETQLKPCHLTSSKNLLINQNHPHRTPAPLLYEHFFPNKQSAYCF